MRPTKGLFWMSFYIPTKKPQNIEESLYLTDKIMNVV